MAFNRGGGIVSSNLAFDGATPRGGILHTELYEICGGSTFAPDGMWISGSRRLCVVPGPATLPLIALGSPVRRRR